MFKFSVDPKINIRSCLPLHRIVEIAHLWLLSHTDWESGIMYHLYMQPKQLFVASHPDGWSTFLAFAPVKLHLPLQCLRR